MIQLFGTEVSLMELTGAVFGIAGVWLTAKENILCFPVGLVNVIISLVLFYQQKLYSDAIQQFVYIILLVYGWIRWIRKDFSKNTLHISFSSQKLLLILFLLCCIFSVAAGTIFSKYTDASLPYWDASATALSFTAQWMIAKKKIENWLLWIVVNVMYIGIYIYKDLLLYTVLFTVYLFVAMKGWIEWRKALKQTEINRVHAG